MILTPKALDCETARSLMFDYIDGVLRESDVMRLEFHIAGCDACRRELEERRAMLADIGRASYDAPPSLYSSVMNKISDIPQEKTNFITSRRFKTWVGALTAVCAAVMILVVGRGYLNVTMNDSDFAADNVGEYVRIDANKFSAPLVSGEDTNSYAAEHATGNTPSNVEDDALAQTEIEVTTSSFTGSAPNEVQGANDIESVGGTTTTANSSLLDMLLGQVTDTEIAVLVCRESDFSGIIPDATGTELTVNDVEYVRYIITEDAMVTFTGYLELLEKLAVDYRAAVPTDAQFDVCEIHLLTDGEN